MNIQDHKKTQLNDDGNFRVCALRFCNLPDAMKAYDIFELLRSKNLFTIMELRIEKKTRRDEVETPNNPEKILPEFITQGPNIILKIEQTKNNTNLIADILEGMENNGSCIKANFAPEEEKYKLDNLCQPKTLEKPTNEDEKMKVEQLDLFLEQLGNIYKVKRYNADDKYTLKFDQMKESGFSDYFQNNSSQEDTKQIGKKVQIERKVLKQQYTTQEKKNALVFAIGNPERLGQKYQNYNIMFDDTHPLFLHYIGLKHGITSLQESRYLQTMLTKKTIPCQNLEFGVFNPNKEDDFLLYWDLLKIRKQNDGIIFTYFDLAGKPSKKVEIIFELPSLNKFVRVEFSFKLSEKIYLERNDRGSLSLYFELNYPPRYSIMSYDDGVYRNFLLNDQWERITHFAFSSDDDTLLSNYLTQSTVIKVSFEKMTPELSRFLEIVRSVKRSIEEYPEAHFQTIDVFQTRPYLTLEKLTKLKLSYEVKYALLACISCRKINIFQITRKFIKNLEKRDSKITEKTLKDIAISCKKSLSRRDFSSNEGLEAFFDELYNDNEKYTLWRTEKEQKHVVKTKRVIITPTLITYHIEETQLSNCVLREYNNHRKRFIRVTLSDEIGEGVKNMNFISETRFKPLLKRLTILDREYRFLAFSSSQLRSNSLWMFNEITDLTIPMIHKSIGDFSEIDNIAKFGARLGQLFSASYPVLNINPDKIQLQIVEDVYSQNAYKYTFSDGVGKISMNLLEQIKVNMKIKGIISAIQIRHGGVKGILVGDPSLKPNQICFRKSMIKFKDSSLNKSIELLDYSKYRPGYLNRQIIILLLTNGLDENFLIKLQEENVKDLNRSDVGDGTIFAYINNEHYLSPTKDLLQGCSEAGIDYKEEPFIQGVTGTIKVRSFINLKEKCNILVRESAKLMGVLDESGYLNYGEVFVCVSKSNGEDKTDIKIIKADKIIVTKNPCLHPGDIRILRAVDTTEAREKFKHLVNCIVFPAKGERPHTDEISGSDLDGDIYFACWDKRLIPTTETKPMIYSRKHTLKQKVEIDDIVDFFVEHANNDILGRIDNSHLALADSDPKIAASNKCISLAELHSIAVDYAKNGVCPSLKRVFLAKIWPDYMEKTPDVTFESSSVLGSLYRTIKFEIEKSGIKKMYKEGLKRIDPRIQIDQDMIVDGFEEHLDKALDILEIYYKDNDALMSLYGIQTEYEIFSGNFLKFMTKGRKYNLEKLQEKIIDHVEEMKNKFLETLLEGFDDESQVKDESGNFTDLIEKKACAIYIASYYNRNCVIDSVNNAMIKLSYKEKREPYFQKYSFQMIGLPWHIFKEVLFQIKKKAVARNGSKI